MERPWWYEPSMFIAGGTIALGFLSVLAIILSVL